MPRITRGLTSHRKHKKVLALTKGHKAGRNNLIKQAKESLLHAGQYALAGRRQRRRDMRKLWIIQLGNALDQEGLSYSRFIATLKTQNILLDRKVLAEIAVKDYPTFKKILSEIAQA